MAVWPQDGGTVRVGVGLHSAAAQKSRVARNASRLRTITASLPVSPPAMAVTLEDPVDHPYGCSSECRELTV